MSTSQSRRLAVAAAILTIAAFSVASAQQPVPPVQPAPGQIRQPVVAAPQGNQWSDHVLEQWLIIDNQGAIEAARFAQNRTQNEQVKQFTNMMLQDHTDFVDNLRKFHERHAAPVDAFGSRPTGVAAQIRQPAGFDFVALKQELGRQCLATFKAEFSKLEGRQFDSCYMGQQVGAHLHMLDTLKVFKRHASPELADLIAQGIDTTEDHLMHAKKLMKEFEGSAETASRPAATEKK